ncbi:uncharacterized protein STAUR_2753 [Stigmatella aurantiaca DW4/3-1]|uniref:Lipoprotein n=1 Tax=Stigmatella aurantiaca (strain DW4/3-1) TaxID=378806 RepID=E3FMF8_STIAD|nr:uncharacterized protein STAUR_2753 [Stigmatella aurantiaca DW4/3-1]
MNVKSLILSVSLGGLLAACGGSPEELPADPSSPLGETEQGICEGWENGARHCTFKCTANDYRHWAGYGDVAYGQCHDLAVRYCGREPYSACWSIP